MEFYNPVHILAGDGVLAGLGENLKTIAREGSPVLLITRGMDFCGSPVHQAVRTALAGYDVREESFIVSNPDVVDIAALMNKVKGTAYSLIIGVGGGSVMDAAKTLAVVLPMDFSTPDELRQAIKSGHYGNAPFIPWIGIPTTSGTGSEATPWATVWDREKECKMSCSHPENFAAYAVVDPACTLTCPKGLTVSSALDAMAHATESFWSRHTSEVTQQFSLLAIRLIRTHLAGLIAHPEDRALREIIGKASLYAGLAFSNTRTTVCHSVSYPITEKFGVPHGTAVALTVGSFLEYNKDAIPRYDELLAAFGCHSAEEVNAWIFAMLRAGGFGTTLRSFGIRAGDIPYIVSHAFTKGRADNNPVPVTEEAVTNILTKLL